MKRFRCLIKVFLSRLVSSRLVSSRLVSSRLVSSRLVSCQSSARPRRQEGRRAGTPKPVYYLKRAPRVRVKRSEASASPRCFLAGFIWGQFHRIREKDAHRSAIVSVVPDLPGVIVIFLEKFLIFIHKCGIARRFGRSRPENDPLKMIKQHRINKFIGRINIGAVAVFSISRESLFLPLSFSPYETFVPIYASRRFRYFNRISIFHE